MARQWGPSMRAAEKAGCVVSASRAGQAEAGSWSCSGVILSRCPDLVLCHGGIFTPFLRAGSAALTAAGASFLPGDSCGDDLRLHVQWGPAAASPAGRAERGRPGLCTPQCAGPEPGPPARPRGRLLEPPRPAELLLLLSCPAFRAHFARLFGGEAAEQWSFASAAPDDEVSEEEDEDQLRALGWFALLRVRPDPEEEEAAAAGAGGGAALGRLGPGTHALAALLPPEVGAPWGLPLRDPGPPWAAAAVLVECGTVWGSGVAVAPRLVVTCRHVAPREAARVLVRYTSPKSATIWGRVVFATQETSPYDIAVVSLDEDLHGVPLPVLAERFHEGEAVSVVGFGVFGQACGPSVTSGILSAVVRVGDTPAMLQTTCAVHAGSSGGPLFSSRTGDLLGIVASNTRDNDTGATYPHLNFSVPITVLQPGLRWYRQTGDLGGLRELDSATEPEKVVWRLQRPLTEAPRSKL
ncbi:peroxisomal leader peptide-processing protease [Ailuropoda melanoleuca]|uniref:peroxisomal leader peptide-processing protease n=1 Tax=Ailuropoda melanoleuca TaxID=9646 RepID=UPI0014941F4E|nr:peroxisomal leader peptide-processing protease [Ailuropoda melanoleuca]